MRKIAFLTIFLVLATLSLLTACGGDNETPDNHWYSAEKAKLTSNVALWQSHNSSTYQFKNRVHQYGSLPITFERTLYISDNAVEQIFDETEKEYTQDRSYTQLTTIDNMFEYVTEEIEKAHFLVEVRYDSTWGYPTYIKVDPLENLADDEYIIHSSDFKNDIQRYWQEEEQAKFEAALERWQIANWSNYQYTNKISQFNYLPINFERTLYILGGDVEQVYDEIDEQFTDERVYMQLATIDATFSFIAEKMLENPDILHVQYHETFGYPSHVRIDPVYGFFDDEYVFTNSEFQ